MSSNRLTTKDVQKSMSKPRPKAKKPTDSGKTLLEYDSDGNLQELMAKEEVCCSHLKIDNKSVYRARVARGNKLFDPVSRVQNNSINAKSRVTQSNVFRMRMVSVKAFNLYISYLKNRNKSLLIQAERELT